MKKTYIMKTVCAVSLTAACAWGLAGCSSEGNASTGTGGVAGTVNGVEIAEDTVTNYIQGVREQLGADDEESWGTWLSQNEYTPASVREEVFNSYAQRELLKEGVEEKGITVESSEIDEQIDKVKQNYDTDEKWQAALDQAGMTEESYRAEIEQKLKENKLYASFASDEDPSDADMLQYAQMYATAYDGSKRSSHILFNSDDEATAQEVLDKLNSGELDFVDAVKEYSQDPGSVELDGDVGWNNPSNLAQEYKDGLEPLEKDQLSGLVTTQFGIHIIKCTDVYTAPEEVTSLDQIPEEWISVIASSLKSTRQQEAYQQWLDEATEAADIKINDMPQGLPYDVDMSKYPAPSTDEGTDGATDGTSEGEATDGQPADGSDAPASEDAAATDGAAEGAADGAAEGDADAGSTEGGDAAAADGQPAEAA